jgi:hypothetical protein
VSSQLVYNSVLGIAFHEAIGLLRVANLSGNGTSHR